MNIAMCERLKQLRLSRGWTQEDVAQKVGVQKAAISKYETGRVPNIKKTIVKKLSEVYMVSESYIEYGTDTETQKLTEQINELYHHAPEENGIPTNEERLVLIDDGKRISIRICFSDTNIEYVKIDDNKMPLGEAYNSLGIHGKIELVNMIAERINR